MVERAYSGRYYSDDELKKLPIAILNIKYRDVLNAIPTADASPFLEPYEHYEGSQTAYGGGFEHTSPGRWTTSYKKCISERGTLFDLAFRMLKVGADIDIRNSEGKRLPSLSLQYSWPGKGPIRKSDRCRLSWDHVDNVEDKLMPFLEKKYGNRQDVRLVISTFYKPRKVHELHNKFYTRLYIIAGIAAAASFITLMSKTPANSTVSSFLTLITTAASPANSTFSFLTGSLAVFFASYGITKARTDMDKFHIRWHVLLPLVLGILTIGSVRACSRDEANKKDNSNIIKKELFMENAHINKQARIADCARPSIAYPVHPNRGNSELYRYAVKITRHRIMSINNQVKPQRASSIF
jgi:hypothetical protein